jgi:capsular polysaccharide biosynthesis protein
MNLKDLRRPFLRWAMGWPGDSTLFGPPRLPPAKIVQVAQESKNEIPELIPVHPEGKILRQLPAIPIGCAPYAAFNIPVAPQTPTYLARVPRGRVLGPTVAVLTCGDRMLSDVSLDWGYAPENHFAYRRFRFPSYKYFSGDAVLLACTGADTYYHFLLDAVPRIEIAKRAWGLSIEPDWWIVNTLNPPFVREILKIAGISLSKVLALDQYPHIGCTTLWVPSLPCSASSGNPPKWAIDFLVGLTNEIQPDSNSDVKSIFIERTGTTCRKLILSDRQREISRKGGLCFISCEKMDWKSQVKLFRGARNIIGPHGAGFSNIVFCSDSSVLEIFPENNLNPCYFALSCYTSSRYGYVVAQKEDRYGRYSVTDAEWSMGLSYLGLG